MSKGWEGGSTRAWRKQRSEVLLRDGGLCQLQLDDCDVYATQVHHRAGITVTGKVVTDPTLLEAACESCNNQLGDPSKADPPPNPPATQW